MPKCAVVVVFAILIFPAFLSGQQLPPLLTALKNADEKSIVSLLNDKKNLDLTDEAGDGPLMYAALYCPPQVMDLLLQAGADPNAQNKLGETALMWSIPDVQKSRLLINHHANVNLLTTDGNNALLIASVGHDQQKIIQLLLAAGADARHPNNRSYTALMRLAQYGDTVSAGLLLQAGAEINARTSDSMTALFMAARSVNVAMVGWLLDHGIDVNLLDNFKAPALFYAATLNEEKIIRMLLGKTNDINLVDIDGVTALMWAVYSEYDNPDLVQLFIDRGANVRFRNAAGETPLSWAQKKGNTKTVALLKSLGAE